MLASYLGELEEVNHRSRGLRFTRFFGGGICIELAIAQNVFEGFCYDKDAILLFVVEWVCRC
jgi:hypothetical protein